MFLILSLYKVPNLMNSSGQIVQFFNSLFCQFSKRMYALRKRKYLPWKLSSESTTITSSFVSLRYVSTNRKHPRRRQISGDELDSCQRESVCIGGKREAEGIGSLDEALLKMEAESVARVQKQNQQKKKRGCTRGFPVAACQRYLRFGFGARFLCHLSLSLSLSFSFSFSLSLCFSSFFLARQLARVRIRVSRVMYIDRSATIIVRGCALSLTGANYTSTEAAMVRRSLRFIFLPGLSSSLGLGFPFPQISGPRLPDVRRKSLADVAIDDWFSDGTENYARKSDSHR